MLTKRHSINVCACVKRKVFTAGVFPERHENIRWSAVAQDASRGEGGLEVQPPPPQKKDDAWLDWNSNATESLDIFVVADTMSTELRSQPALTVFIIVRFS